jgi:hypothetical protein
MPIVAMRKLRVNKFCITKKCNAVFEGTNENLEECMCSDSRKPLLYKDFLQ